VYSAEREGRRRRKSKTKTKKKVLGITFAHTSLTHENTINQLSHFSKRNTKLKFVTTTTN
jgi:hypothetical protein